MARKKRKRMRFFEGDRQKLTGQHQKIPLH